MQKLYLSHCSKPLTCLSPITIGEKNNNGSVVKAFAGHVKADVVNPVVNLVVNDVVNLSQENGQPTQARR